MSKKTVLLIVAALLLGAFSLYVNRDRFLPENIQISSRAMQPRNTSRPSSTPRAMPMVFLFSQELQLTALKVLPVSGSDTNTALWELVSDSKSPPIKDLRYGANVAGMRPIVPGEKAKPLQPGVTYRLLITCGSRKAEHEFTPPAQ